MSKTKADVAKLLAASNEQLFDRYVNIKLMQKLGGVTRASHSYTPGLSQPEAVTEDDFVLITPKTGIKPRITVSGQFIADEYVANITVTVHNMSEQIDTMTYNWAEIELGYLNSGIHSTFIGQITNCYMAKPNPNGELVVNVTCASLTDMYTRGDIEIEFESDSVDVKELLSDCFNGIIKAIPDLDGHLYSDGIFESIDKEWLKHKFFIRKGNRFFRSGFEVITWLNSVFASYAYHTDYAWGAGEADVKATDTLPPMKLGFDAQGQLRITGSYADTGPANTKALSAIGSAFLSGEEATVTGPFNPGIMPGDVVYIDVKYFKTRVNIEGQTREMYKSLGNMWSVISMKFTFDTMSTNNMLMQVNNLNNKITAGGIQK